MLEQFIRQPTGQLAYVCQHVQEHRGILSLDPYEMAWRRWFDFQGWRRWGYCYLYYPTHARESWAKYDAPTIAEGI